MKITVDDVSLGLLTLSLLTMMALSATRAAAAGVADQDFVTRAAIGGVTEVEMGKLAGDRASSADVKKFAEKMVTDHTKANEELEKIATGKSLKVPNALDADHK